MTQDEIIDMAKQVGFSETEGLFRTLYISSLSDIQAFAKLVAAKERDRYMQLFLDPENQPTQFGTATQEYRDAEKADLLKRLEIAKEVWRKDNELLLVLKEIAHIVRTSHLYGPEMKKLLEQEEAIRARGEA